MMYNTLKCVVIDDEPIARTIIEKYIKTLPFLEVVASCEDAIDALSYISNNPVDIIFSDIQMPNISGLEFVKSIKNKAAVIFITAHSEYAIDGFEIGVVDFISKPFEFERFILAVNRAQVYLKKNIQIDTNKSDVIYIKSKGTTKLVKVVTDDIIYIEVIKDYLKIVTKTGVYMMLMTIKGIQKLLDPNQFFKTHRSFIINIDAIQSFSGNIIEMNNTSEIPIVQSKKEELFIKLNILK
jgi:two-component system, LytTR family, response regulator